MPTHSTPPSTPRGDQTLRITRCGVGNKCSRPKCRKHFARIPVVTKGLFFVERIGILRTTVQNDLGLVPRTFDLNPTHDIAAEEAFHKNRQATRAASALNINKLHPPPFYHKFSAAMPPPRSNLRLDERSPD